MSKLRSMRERCVQTLAYEAGGLVIVTPLYALVTGQSSFESLSTLIAVSIACMVWAGVHNSVFDWVEHRFTRRVASDRSHGMRLCHASCHEVTSILVTTPVIMLVGGHGFWDAVLIDIGLTLAYTAYAYVFHMLFDWLRPVQRTVQRRRAVMGK